MKMESDSERRQSAFYHIAVQGALDAAWQEWFSGMTITIDQNVGGVVTTILHGFVADQAALRGILNKLWDLNLTVVGVQREG